MKIDFVEADRPNRLRASVTVETRDPRLAERLARAISALSLPRAPRYEAVVVRDAIPDLTGKIALLHVRRASTLAARVAAVRAANPLGIQLVFADRRASTRLRAAVFAVLEAARGARGCPLFLARTRRPALALRLAISKKGAPS